MALPFQSELMRCVVCGAKQQSDPEVGSNWTAIEIPIGGRESIRFYACPTCVPGPFPDSAESVKLAYEMFVQAALLEMRAHI